jgi:hypothetical protein
VEGSFKDVDGAFWKIKMVRHVGEESLSKESTKSKTLNNYQSSHAPGSYFRYVS